MAQFIKGDVVVVPFPFSAATSFKNRPALVVASWPFGGSDDYLVCIITSQPANDPYLLNLDGADLENGSLHRTSYLRPTYLFAVGEGQIARKVGNLTRSKMSQVTSVIVAALAK